VTGTSRAISMSEFIFPWKELVLVFMVCVGGMAMLQCLCSLVTTVFWSSGFGNWKLMADNGI